MFAASWQLTEHRLKNMKMKTQYVCSNCGSVSIKWLGKCPDCGKWNTFAEEAYPAKNASQRQLLSGASHPERIDEINTAEHLRITTKIDEFDRVLGGGIVPGSVTLLGGAPGIGKSTLLLQVSEGVSNYGTVLYVSGEESPRQIKMRADRLGACPENLYILSEVSLENIIIKLLNLTYFPP